jgi:hypothetical protein
VLRRESGIDRVVATTEAVDREGDGDNEELSEHGSRLRG